MPAPKRHAETIKASSYATPAAAIEFAKQLCRQSMRHQLQYDVLDAVGSSLATVSKESGVLRVHDYRGR